MGAWSVMAGRGQEEEMVRAGMALGRAVREAVKAGASEAGARAGQADILRCIVGNPFRPLSLKPRWLTWQGGIARRLARMAYDQRHMPSGTLEPDRLAVLADALEEAGADADILGHLRGPGPHVRGCFLLNLVIGME